jgi:hypothetical protein
MEERQAFIEANDTCREYDSAGRYHKQKMWGKKIKVKLSL